MKKTVALITALALVFSLSACGDKTASQDEIPDTTSVEETTEEEPEEAPAPEISPEEKLQSALGEMPYYGDTAKCAMTAEQATAYAQLIADGLAGDFSFRDGYDETVDIVSWSEPFEIVSTDGIMEMVEETDRANVMLADFAGDGNPYLYVYSSLTEGSFEIYGWTDDNAKLAFHAENGYNQTEANELYEDDSDEERMKFFCSDRGSTVFDFYIYSFSDGTVTQEGTTITGDVLNDVWQVYENGTEVGVYTDEEYLTPWEWKDNHTHTLPYTCFYDMTPCTLEEMVNYLNAYATVMSDGQSVPVEIKKVEPPENSDSESKIGGVPEKDLQGIDYSIVGNDIIYNNKTFKDLSANFDFIVSETPYDKDTLIKFVLYTYTHTYEVDDEEIYSSVTHDEDADTIEKILESGADYCERSVDEIMREATTEEITSEYLKLYDKYNEAATWTLDLCTFGGYNRMELDGCKSYIIVSTNDTQSGPRFLTSVE